MEKEAESRRIEDDGYPMEVIEAADTLMMIKGNYFGENIENIPSSSCSNSSCTSNDYQLPALLQGLVPKTCKPFNRELKPSDVRDRLSRLVFPKDKFKDFIAPLLDERDDISAGIDVTTYDETGKEYPMIFKCWSKKYYVLSTGWKQFYHDHDLMSDKCYQDVLNVWMFRHFQTNKLCCAITSTRTKVFPK